MQQVFRMLDNSHGWSLRYIVYRFHVVNASRCVRGCTGDMGLLHLAAVDR